MIIIRSILEKARVKNDKNDELWVHAIRLEVEAGNDSVAQALLARGLQVKLQHCKSPLLVILK